MCNGDQGKREIHMVFVEELATEIKNQFLVRKDFLFFIFWRAGLAITLDLEFLLGEVERSWVYHSFDSYFLSA